MFIYCTVMCRGDGMLYPVCSRHSFVIVNFIGYRYCKWHVLVVECDEGWETTIMAFCIFLLPAVHPSADGSVLSGLLRLT